MRGGGIFTMFIPILYCMSFLISVVLIPLVIRLCRYEEWYDTVNSRKVHSGNVPRLGSIGFVVAFAVTAVVFYFVKEETSAKEILPLIIAGLIIFLFGILDDFKDLSASFKLLVQILATVIMICNGYRFKQIGSFNLHWLSYVFSFCWYIGVINAFNLIDGVDALCGGLSFFILITLGIIYTVSASIEPATLCFILAVAILGFLVYNKPKAKIFMGDGGSQFLGFMIATLSLFPMRTTFEPNRFFAVFLLCSIPIFDTLAAIWRRKREHRPFFSPDKAHLHHKLINMGYSTSGILVILYILQIGICCIALLGLWVYGLKGMIILLGGIGTMIMFFAVIHYTNRAVNKKNKLLTNGNVGEDSELLD